MEKRIRRFQKFSLEFPRKSFNQKSVGIKQITIDIRRIRINNEIFKSRIFDVSESRTTNETFLPELYNVSSTSRSSQWRWEKLWV